MVLCIYTIKATRANARNIIAILKSVSARTNIKKGCASSRIWMDVTDPGRVLLMEEWESLQDLRMHLVTPAFRRIILSMELSREKPEIKVIQCGHAMGQEWLEDQIAGKEQHSEWEITVDFCEHPEESSDNRTSDHSHI